MDAQEQSGLTGLAACAGGGLEKSMDRPRSGAALAVVAVADAGEQRRRHAGHGNVLRRVAVVAAIRGGGHQVVQHGEAGLAGEHVVMVLVLASVPRRWRRRRIGSSRGHCRGRRPSCGA
jgi:hypothetical protein